MGKKKKTVWCIKHYRSDQKILLVGEGDFSFALSLANAFGNKTSKMFATSLDSEEEVMLKYRAGESNLEDLNDTNCTILHEVDARTLSRHAVLKRHRFDRIVFNFPHSTVPLARHMLRDPEQDDYHIELHKNLVRGFLNSAYKLLSKTGEIHITHKTMYPFDRWNIMGLAEDAGLKLVDEVPFYKWEYPGYTNKKGEGHGTRCDRTFPVGTCSTFMFSVRWTTDLNELRSFMF